MGQPPTIKKVIKQIKLRPVPDIPDFTPYIEVVNSKIVPYQVIWSSIKIGKYPRFGVTQQ